MANGSVTAVRDLLQFYADNGVDAPLRDEAVDRFADDAALPPRQNAQQEQPAPSSRPKPPPARAETRSTAAPANGIAPAVPEAAATAAREAARTAASMAELRAILAGFDGCALKATAKQLVFADGNPQANVMFVGEAPGRDEDIEGLPFVGRSGKLLDRMIGAIGLDRTSVYIANIIPWRPPGNRTPTPQEAAICLPFIKRQIELCDPAVLVCLGGPSAQTLLGIKDGITKARGRWMDYDNGGKIIRAIALFHPAYLLRTPLAKRLAWRDLLAIKKVLTETAQP